jgi:hypothetical protein
MRRRDDSREIVKMATQTPRVAKLPCIECGGGPRNHDIVREFEQTWSTEDDQGATTYEICVCRGCETVRFRERAWDTMTLDSEGQPATTVRVFPEVPGAERASVEIDDFPEAVGRIYLETVRALNARAMILAGGGLRAIVEAICIDQKVSGRNLQEKIDALVAKGLLAKPQAELLHEERYIGNAALHEISPPSKADIEDGLLIVEGLLNTIYTLPGRAERLRRKRQKGKPAGSRPSVKPPAAP